MNEFEKKMNALRIQFKAEQRQITKDSCRIIGRLNKAISMVQSPEARQALRDEKERVYESMRRSHELNKTCYFQKLELLSDQLRMHFHKSPSKSSVRRLIASLIDSAEASGEKSISIAFGDNRHATITFD